MSKTFGSHIRNIRRKQDMRLVDLSEKADLSVPYLSEVERGISNPSLRTMEKLAKGLGMHLYEIADYEEKIPAYSQRLVDDVIRIVRNSLEREYKDEGWKSCDDANHTKIL